MTDDLRVCFEKTYDLDRCALRAPLAGGAIEARIEDKQRHGADEFVGEGDVALRDGRLVMHAMNSAAWASPNLWSGVKNVRVRARVRIDQLGDAPQLGIKFGRVWALEAGGPRIVLHPDAGRIAYSGEKDQAPAAEAELAVPVGETFDLDAEYAFDARRVRVDLNGARVLDLALPHEPFENFLSRHGRPAPLAGVGAFAAGVNVSVASFPVRAGAPWRRVVAIGDSNTQRHFWVQALERALGEPVTNLGIGGDCAAFCRLRFARDVPPLAPRICIIYIGANDLGWKRTADQFAGDVEFMALAARENGIRPLVGEVLARRGYGNVAAANAALHAMCAHHGIDMLRWYDATHDPNSDEMLPGYAPDGCHPVRLGGEAMVRALDLDLFKEQP